MANDVNVSQLSLTYVDYSKEKSTSTVGVRSLADNAAYESAKIAFTNSLAEITLGLRTQEIESRVSRLTNLFPSDPNAQREDKLLVRYQDNSTLNIYTVTFPCIDIDAVEFVLNTDFINLDDAGVGAAFKAAFEALVASPIGNAVTIIDAQFVGRNT